MIIYKSNFYIVIKTDIEILFYSAELQKIKYEKFLDTNAD